jgi:hypothetical protein
MWTCSTGHYWNTLARHGKKPNIVLNRGEDDRANDDILDDGFNVPNYTNLSAVSRVVTRMFSDARMDGRTSGRSDDGRGGVHD